MIRQSLAALALAGMLLPAAAAPKARQKQPKPVDGPRYISELMSRMTLDEKIGQLNLQVAGDITTGSAQDTEVGGLVAQGQLGAVLNLKGADKIRALQDIAVKQSRLGIPLFAGLDVIHGYETIFPIPLAMAASWNPDAMQLAAATAAREATADGISWVYSPMVDIARDARWGRTAEGAGEDPYLGALMARAQVAGYQGDGTWPLPVDKAMACMKHWGLYGAAVAGRDYNTVDMSTQQMYNDYFPPYRAAVEAGVGSVMTSFNVINGVPAVTNQWLNYVLRDKWRFDGFTVTDYGAIEQVVPHGTAASLADASVQALHAGTDMDMCSRGFVRHLREAVEAGQVTEAQVDEACRRVLEAKWRMGLFDDPYRYLDAKRHKKDVYTDANRAVARDIAAQTFVLLKNNRQLLPLKKQGKIALIGPLADNGDNMVGTWAVAYTPGRYTTLRQAMEQAVAGRATIAYAQGANLTRDEATQQAAEFGKTIARGDEKQLHDEAISVARDADVIVVAMGESAEMSGESSSRADIHTPDVQLELLADLQKLGKPIVMLNFSGRATILKWESEHIDAIMNVWFAGSETGGAICDVLFGDKTPEGRLPVTMPQAMGQLPLYYNQLPTGRGVPPHADSFHKFESNYIDVRNDALYPFGYGLTYTTFSITAPQLSASEMTADGQVKVTVTVTNTGQRDGSEVVQLYVHDRVASLSRPVKELKGFKRVALKAGESRQVEFTITRNELKFYDGEGRELLEPGTFDIMVGSNSDQTQAAELTLK